MVWGLSPCSGKLLAMQNLFLIDGKPDGTISPYDRGFLYGDGVFRTLPIHLGLPEQWSRQYRKLDQDCTSLGIACPPEKVLLDDLATLFHDGADGVAKIVVTRGESARGYAVPAGITPRRIVQRSARAPYPASYRSEGVGAHLCRMRLAAQPRLAGIKHLNRLENVLARMEWSDSDIAEGVLMDQEGRVIEGTMSNLFLRTGTLLRTPDLARCGVAGVTRDRILELAPELGLATEIGDITLDALKSADEVVLCNSLIGVWPVRSLDGHRWQTGALAQQLQQLLDR
jgi:4-amino-4-deoxychorismate lyase